MKTPPAFTRLASTGLLFGLIWVSASGRSTHQSTVQNLPPDLQLVVAQGPSVAGAKMLAAPMIYGDSVGGALMDDREDATADLLNDLVRKALGQIQVGRAEGVFGRGFDDSPLGLPVAVNPMLRSFAELAARRRELIGKRSRKPGVMQEKQMTLF